MDRGGMREVKLQFASDDTVTIGIQLIMVTRESWLVEKVGDYVVKASRHVTSTELTELKRQLIEKGFTPEAISVTPE